jgi:hypothetical protein
MKQHIATNVELNKDKEGREATWLMSRVVMLSVR